MKRFLVLLVVLSVALGTVLAVRLRQQAKEAEAPPGSSGLVELTRVTVASRLATRVTKVLVREGDSVEPGQLLIELDCAESDALVNEAEAHVAAAQAQIDGAKSLAAAGAAQALAAEEQVRSQKASIGSVKVQEANALREALRAKRLETAGAATTEARQNAQTVATDLQARLAASSVTIAAAGASAVAVGKQADAATENVRAAEDMLTAGQAALARARVAQTECKITSPVKGVVTVRSHEPGEVVLPGTILLELTDWRETKVMFYVANRDLGGVAVGVKVHVVADPYPGETFAGVVRRVSDEAEFTPRTIQTRSDRDRLVYLVEAVVQNPQRRLRAGMPVEVAVASPPVKP